MATAATVEASLLTEVRDGVATLTLNRPEKRNALSEELLGSLYTVLREVERDDMVRVIVIAARGPVFSSGHDLGEMIGRNANDYRTLFSLCGEVMQRLRRQPQPVIARVQGPATAAGCQLVASCDLAVAADSATFATPGVKIGLFCTTPMVPLVRAVPAKAALEMLLTGKPVTAQQALAWGLVNRVVPAANLDGAVGEFVSAILASSSLIVRLGKKAFYDLLPLSESEAYTRATEVMIVNAQKYDAQEGMQAFLEKRRPHWEKQGDDIGPERAGIQVPPGIRPPDWKGH
jgi:enoyl-CoA hydratase/carnithine racemase